MDACRKTRPLLNRVADGEAAPGEAMGVGAHVARCTACRILLARERRLCHMLENDWEDTLPVGEDFVAAVMANVPRDAPPRSRRTARSLKLA